MSSKYNLTPATELTEPPIEMLERFQELTLKENGGNISLGELEELNRIQKILNETDERRWAAHGKPFYEQETRRQHKILNILKALEIRLNKILKKPTPKSP